MASIWAKWVTHSIKFWGSKTLLHSNCRVGELALKTVFSWPWAPQRQKERVNDSDNLITQLLLRVMFTFLSKPMGA